MAKTSEITFGTWEPPVKVNPYTDIMAAFLKASDENPNASYVLTVDADKVTTERNKFGKAANDVNRTANLRQTVIDGDRAHLTFTLGKRHKSRRGQK